MNEFPIGIAAGIWTALSMLLFIGVVIWAYSKSNKKRFEQAARLAVNEVEPENHNTDEIPAKERVA